MPKSPEPDDHVVWATEEGFMHGIVRKRDQFGVNMLDEDGKTHRVKAHEIAAVVLPENAKRLAYALSKARCDHRKRLDDSHATLRAEQELALTKWRV